MARRVVPTDLEKDGHEYLYYRDRATEATKKKNELRDRLVGWVTLRDQNGRLVNGEETAEGHRIFPIPSINGLRLMAQRKVSSEIDLDETEKLLLEKDPTGKLYDRVFKKKEIREFDEGELYLLYQLDVLTADELDGLAEEKESYALVTIKDEAAEEASGEDA